MLYYTILTLFACFLHGIRFVRYDMRVARYDVRFSHVTVNFVHNTVRFSHATIRFNSDTFLSCFLHAFFLGVVVRTGVCMPDQLSQTCT
jgi:hypothetical protein